MILPNKHLRPDRSILGIGGEILEVLKDDQTVSELWHRVQERRDETTRPLSFDWFILSLSFLFAIGAVSLDRGLLIRIQSL